MEDEAINGNVIVTDLTDMPIGRWGTRKCLTKRENRDGITTYSIREYVPRGTFINGEKKPPCYTPARGIDLTEEELEKICIILRKDLYILRCYNNTNADTDEYVLDDSDDKDSDNYKDNSNKNDMSEHDIIGQVNSESFEKETGCKQIEILLCIERPDKVQVRLSLVSWYGGIPMYDIREYMERVDAQGYREYYPEIDKGVSLDDAECECLCQGIEYLIPELADGLEEYRTDDWDCNLNTVSLSLSDGEQKIASNAIFNYMNTLALESIQRCSRGSCIGEQVQSDLYDKCDVLYRKLELNQRVTDDELGLLKTILSIEAGMEKNVLIQKTLRNIELKTAMIQKKRENVFCHGEHEEEKICQVDATKEECGIIVDALQLVYDKLFDGNVLSERLMSLIHNLDLVAVGNTKSGANDSADKTTPAKNLFEDLIMAFRSAMQ